MFTFNTHLKTKLELFRYLGDEGREQVCSGFAYTLVASDGWTNSQKSFAKKNEREMTHLDRRKRIDQQTLTWLIIVLFFSL